MIGAMPAVAVRHERRRQEKRGCGPANNAPSLHHHHGSGGSGGMLYSRPSQLCVGNGSNGCATWPPPHSPCSASPSPGQHCDGYDIDDRLPEYYVCGKVSALQLVVGSLLLGAIVLVVGLVQLTPGAVEADHRFYLMGAGTSLIALGLALTAVRCWCMHCPRKRDTVIIEQPQGVSSIDVLVRDGVVSSPSELDVLIKGGTVPSNGVQKDPEQPPLQPQQQQQPQPQPQEQPQEHHHHHHHHHRHDRRHSRQEMTSVSSET